MNTKDFEFPTKKQCLSGLNNIRKIRGELQRIKTKQDRKKVQMSERIRVRANQLQSRSAQ